MSKPVITQIDHIHVVTTDMEKSLDFYINTLGFYMARRISMNGRDQAYVGLGDILLELHPPPRGATEIPAGASRPFGLTVANMDETLAYLRDKGVEVLEEREGWTFYGKHATIKDPSGIVIELRQWYENDGPNNPDWQPRRDDIVRTA
jgi:catechol 2,3-dioxygenase-like lactoylglutathione lyase family enzyme